MNKEVDTWSPGLCQGCNEKTMVMDYYGEWLCRWCIEDVEDMMELENY